MSHRDALLEAARRLILEKGFAATTARDLVSASGTNLGSIGYHFGSREALLGQAMEELFDEFLQVGQEAGMMHRQAPAKRLRIERSMVRSSCAVREALQTGWRGHRRTAGDRRRNSSTSRS